MIRLGNAALNGCTWALWCALLFYDSPKMWAACFVLSWAWSEVAFEVCR